MSLNNVCLHGNLTRKPETRYTTGGTSVTSFGLAVNERWTGDDGERRERATFVDCTAWGKLGEVLAENLDKGDPLVIAGRLQMDEWTDKETKAKRTKLGVVVETFSFCGGGRKPDDAGTTPATRSASSSKTSPSATAGSNSNRGAR